MTLSERICEFVRACFTGIWIESHEHDDATAELAELCRQQSWNLATWDIEQGLQVGGEVVDTNTDADPLAAVRALSSLAQPDGTALLVLKNFHRFIQSPEIIQALVRQITLGKQHRTFAVVLAPYVQLPVELEKLFVVVEHALPRGSKKTQTSRKGIRMLSGPTWFRFRCHFSATRLQRGSFGGLKR